jgi:hypothetical protein
MHAEYLLLIGAGAGAGAGPDAPIPSFGNYIAPGLEEENYWSVPAFNNCDMYDTLNGSARNALSSPPGQYNAVYMANVNKTFITAILALFNCLNMSIKGTPFQRDIVIDKKQLNLMVAHLRKVPSAYDEEYMAKTYTLLARQIRTLYFFLDVTLDIPKQTPTNFADWTEWNKKHLEIFPKREEMPIYNAGQLAVNQKTFVTAMTAINKVMIQRSHQI